MKKVLAIILALVLGACFCGCNSSSSDKNNTKEDLSKFYNRVSESQKLLDVVADDIYSNWYDAIYNDDFGEDINYAILSAQIDNAENLERIEELDKEISELFKEVKNSKYGDVVKDVMSAYSDYYEFVVNVSGSFNSYSADKENLKKELASVLKDLSYEF